LWTNSGIKLLEIEEENLENLSRQNKIKRILKRGKKQAAK